MLAPGRHQLLLRVATPDPFILPLYLLSAQQFESKAIQNYYSYGFIYGYLLALMAFNVMLFFGLRDNRYLWYGIYLSVFLLANVSYTGHGFAWLWPNFPEWQRWTQSILVVCFGIAGLMFAISFLSLREHCYRLYCTVIGIMLAAVILLSLSIVLQQQTLSRLIAFGFIAVYPLAMLWMGIRVFPYNNIGAGYYFAAAIVGVLGVALTTASVWGFMRYKNWAFHAVEIAMLIETTLLALALAARIRQVHKRQQSAEQLASTDPLTNLSNRRGFYLISPSLWGNSVRYTRKLSAIFLDVDKFKQLNDTHGHACGDQVLRELSNLLQQQVRQSDFIARWGGEEFLILLPETCAQEASNFAERLRKKFASQQILCGNVPLHVSASFGVAERRLTDSSIDQLIERADCALYQAKHAGRNCTRTIGINDVVD
jgi:two-component system, sensor histidine kinase LadS